MIPAGLPDPALEEIPHASSSAAEEGGQQKAEPALPQMQQAPAFAPGSLSRLPQGAALTQEI
jgi:hypothetical protein